MRNEIFISYTQPNKNVAFAIHDLLQSNGLSSWIDKSPNYGIISGKYFGEQIVRAIKDCKLFVLVYSQYSNLSTEVIKEVSNADDKEKHVFKVDNSAYSDRLAYCLTGLHYIDAAGNNLQSAYLILLNNLKLGLRNFGQRVQLSTDKILLNNGLKLLKQKNYENAEIILTQYNSIAYDDIDAKFYLAIAIGRGKKPRKLDGLIVRRIESLLNPYIGQSEYGHINVLLAFIKFGYYTMNGFIEPLPDANILLQNVRSAVEKLNEILFHFDDPDNEVWRMINSTIHN